HDNANGKCPFCQETIPDNTKEELIKLFDLEYLQAEESVNSLRETIQSNLNELDVFKQSVNDIKEVTSTGLITQIDQIKDYYLILQSKILERSKDLSAVVQLDEVGIPESLDSEVKLV